MPMQKKANGANFQVANGDLTLKFDAGNVPIVFVVCIWGPKPQYGGQRQKVWCSEQLSSPNDGDTVEVPTGMAMAGAQITWSGGLIAPGEAQGRLLVTVLQQGRDEAHWAYEYNFTEKNQTDSFYDGLNFT